MPNARFTWCANKSLEWKRLCYRPFTWKNDLRLREHVDMLADPSVFDVFGQSWVLALIGASLIAIAIAAYGTSVMNDFAFASFFVGLAILVAVAERWLSGEW